MPSSNSLCFQAYVSMSFTLQKQQYLFLSAQKKYLQNNQTGKYWICTYYQMQVKQFLNWLCCRQQYDPPQSTNRTSNRNILGNMDFKSEKDHPNEKPNFANEQTKQNSLTPKQNKQHTELPKQNQQHSEPLRQTQQSIQTARQIVSTKEDKAEQQNAYNSKFENSVKQRNSYYPIDQINRESFKQSGLVNVGNTCYLNAILQMLYSARKFKNAVIKLAKLNPNYIFHNYISDVFNDIDNKSDSYTKSKHLRALSIYLQQSNQKFALYSQNDALQCLLQVLNLLQEEDPANSKLRYFKIVYEPHCDCTKGGNSYVIQCYFVKSGELCTTCNKQIKYCIHNSGPYLISMTSSKFKFRSRMKMTNKDKKEAFYENKAFITYFGNRVSGHYICHRKTIQGWILINDNRVDLIGNLASVQTIPMITMYEFTPYKNQLK